MKTLTEQIAELRDRIKCDAIDCPRTTLSWTLDALEKAIEQRDRAIHFSDYKPDLIHNYRDKFDAELSRILEGK